jgi:hypothetical protein
VDIENVVFTMCERQIGEERACGFIELSPRPTDGGAGIGVHILLGTGHGRIMIAKERNRPGLDMRPHRFDHPRRISPVADVIAEKDGALDLGSPRVREAGLESLAVAMDVAHQGDAHRRQLRPSPSSAQAAQASSLSSAAVQP